MPKIKCRAKIAGIDTSLQRELSFNWRFKVEYESDSLVRNMSVVGIKDTLIDFGVDFAGGYVSL